jgi:hypothetical protein
VSFAVPPSTAARRPVISFWLNLMSDKIIAA